MLSEEVPFNTIIDKVEEDRILQAYVRRDQPEVAARYSYFDTANLLNLQQLERRVLFSLREFGYAPLHNRRILDVGCGAGRWLQIFLTWGAQPENLSGIDLLEHRIAAARRILPHTVRLHEGSATHLQHDDNSFDLVLQFTTFTSIFSAYMKRRIASEMVRVIKPNGRIIWYDFFFNNPFNSDVRGIGRSEIENLFPECRLKLFRLTLAPPVARVLSRISPFTCELAIRSRVLCTHYLGFIEKS
jgi:ubiquinone/menaquinone biosynthesis C-methylase UbiE